MSLDQQMINDKQISMHIPVRLPLSILLCQDVRHMAAFRICLFRLCFIDQFGCAEIGFTTGKCEAQAMFTQ